MITWAVQENLDPEGNTWKKIKKACEGIALYQGFMSIPFDDKLPEIDIEGKAIFYGATRAMKLIGDSKKWNPGTYFDEEKFNFKAWKKNYGNLILNYDAGVMKLADILKLENTNETVFMRPARDLKEFPGSIVELSHVQKWVNDISGKGYDVNENTEIVIGEAYNISHEWRLFIVDGKVSSGSHYRTYFHLNIKGSVPDFVEEFAMKCCNIWMPAPVFVMDIGLCADNLYIIEVNCFNSSGFYAADVDKIVKDITNYELGSV